MFWAWPQAGIQHQQGFSLARSLDKGMETRGVDIAPGAGLKYAAPASLAAPRPYRSYSLSDGSGLGTGAHPGVVSALVVEIQRHSFRHDPDPIETGQDTFSGVSAMPCRPAPHARQERYGNRRFQ